MRSEGCALTPLRVTALTFSMTTFRYSMLAAVSAELTICQKYPAAENERSVTAEHSAETAMRPMQAQMPHE
jgi:hypothetical protein